MDNKEAIETLKQLILQGNDERLKNDYEAIDTAIKALEERPQGDLISREELKKALKSNCDLCHDKNTNWCEHCCPLNDFEDLIDNAPTVDIKDQIAGAYNEGYMCGSREAEKARPQGEITNEDIQQAIKEGFANGYEMAKEKIIHSIAKQYSEHNKLVPIWLSIGDIKGGAE